MEPAETAILKEWVSRRKIPMDDQRMGLLDVYLKELWEWNRRINLTGLGSRQDVVRELLLDSLMPCPILPEEGVLLDVGSGAGFPALPIKICRPGLLVHMVEANARRVSFLRQAIRLTGLTGIEVFRGRVEEGHEGLLTGGYPFVTARAVAPPAQSLTWCAPRIRPGGCMLLFLGEKVDEALADARPVMETHALTERKKIPYQLPGKKSLRYLVVLEKALQTA